jgi:exodeoxyribonuclease VII large subunit
VPLECLEARRDLEHNAASLRRGADGAIGARARHLAALARGPARALRRERVALNQRIREIRASSERGLAERRSFQRRIAVIVLERARRRAAGADLGGRREALRRIEVALRAHEPDRTLERGYALAETPDGEPLTSAEAAGAEDRINLRFADGRIDVRKA